ncbi:gamma-glutamyl-gamma-aminobutyrate hydrolase family protein [Mesorhizobium sp.]|uniref:gamma-glutamyl-gamma-aminobutyrate hydrolase family protein n=1 Tax=Mesorhizobium sp. TaxID=1871066 RepID=UPI00120BCBE2|nr:gamma-glutamyl-gamma-aminobutyrate hydrolase family protein [Mesorhizobium sp.]TIP43758.1 MAG: gamma-glutamyl-gamma-aminobutyrate hydrolase family protein [Mesorhizobium sp.]
MANYKKPLIGIVGEYDVEKESYVCDNQYVRAIEKAGALPIILPYVKADHLDDVLDLISGLVLTGGKDLSTEFYDAAPHPAAVVQPERDNFEFALARLALKRSMPILGICRGMQLLNVVAGGTLYPHTIDELPNGLDHRNGIPLDQTAHDVLLEPDTRLFQYNGGSPSLRVNSGHHQAVKRLAPDFIISARANDGLAEAIEAPGRPFVIGVQWHPEFFYDSEPTSRNLFHSFVNASRSIAMGAASEVLPAFGSEQIDRDVDRVGVWGGSAP